MSAVKVIMSTNGIFIFFCIVSWSIRYNNFQASNQVMFYWISSVLMCSVLHCVTLYKKQVMFSHLLRNIVVKYLIILDLCFDHDKQDCDYSASEVIF